MDQLVSSLASRAKELGLTNAEVARRAGLSERRYGHYVRGRNEPDLATLIRIAEVLETTPNVLLGVEKAPKADPLRDRINAALTVMDEKDRALVAACLDVIIAGRRDDG